MTSESSLVALVAAGEAMGAHSCAQTCCVCPSCACVCSACSQSGRRACCTRQRRWTLAIVLPIAALVAVFCVFTIDLASLNQFAKSVGASSLRIELQGQLSAVRSRIADERYELAAFADPGARGTYVHFVWPHTHAANLSFAEYAALKAASYYVARGPVMLHVASAAVAPGGPWWSAAEPFVLVVPFASHVDDELAQFRLMSPSARSLYVRLSALAKFGGVALDLDVLALRSFDKLLAANPEMLVSIYAATDQAFVRASSAVIVARVGSRVVNDWINAFSALDAGQSTGSVSIGGVDVGEVISELWIKAYSELHPSRVLFVTRHAFLWPPRAERDSVFANPFVRLNDSSALALKLWQDDLAPAYTWLLHSADDALASASYYGDAVRLIASLPA